MLAVVSLTHVSSMALPDLKLIKGIDNCVGGYAQYDWLRKRAQ